VLIYLLIVVDFQSCLDPLVMGMALPTALAGIVGRPPFAFASLDGSFLRFIEIAAVVIECSNPDQQTSEPNNTPAGTL
jgi:hypothetical protein